MRQQVARHFCDVMTVTFVRSVVTVVLFMQPGDWYPVDICSDKGVTMTTESNVIEQKPQKRKVIYQRGTSEAVYGLGMIGAWIYYLTHAATFWMGVLGIFKGIFWPAVLVYEVFKALNM